MRKTWSLPAALVLAVTTLAVAAESGPGVAAVDGVQTSAATTLRTAVVVANFTNSRIDSSTEFRDMVADKYFGSGQSLRRYYEEASDGRVSFAPLAGKPAVLGVWTIDTAATCNGGAIFSKAREQLAAHGIGTAAYDRMSVLVPKGSLSCDWAGLGQQPGKDTVLWDSFSRSGLIHEMGHNFGYHHLPATKCDQGRLTDCADTGYRRASPMGGGGENTGLAPAELIHSGWYRSDQRLKDPADGTYRLVPLHAASSVSGPRMLDLPTDGSGGRVVVSYRKSDSTIDVNNETGVMLYRTGTTGYARSALVDATPVTSPDDNNDLPVGAAITTPDGTRITLVSLNDDAAVIRIGDPQTTTTPAPTTTTRPTTTTTRPTTTTAPPTTTPAPTPICFWGWCWPW